MKTKMEEEWWVYEVGGREVVTARSHNHFVTAVGWRRRRSTCRPAAGATWQLVQAASGSGEGCRGGGD